MLDGEDFERRWRVAILAHPERQAELVDFLRRHREHAVGWRIVSTAGLAEALSRGAGLRASGTIADAWHRDAGLLADLAAGAIDALVALRAAAAASGPDAGDLLRVADAANVPAATNLGSARCLVLALASHHPLAPARA
jgi:methylglyoxal synthase